MLGLWSKSIATRQQATTGIFCSLLKVLQHVVYLSTMIADIETLRDLVKIEEEKWHMSFQSYIF